MKKLIIASAIVIATVMSQAATFNWDTAGKAYSIASDTITSGLAAGTTYGVGSNNAASMANQISSFGASWTYAMTLTYGSDSQTLTGSLAAGDFTSRMIHVAGLESSLFDLGAGETERTVDYAIVLTGTLKDGNGDTWTITSDTIAGSQSYGGVGDLSLSTAGASKWTTSGSEPVPEPTSGLLMLLGVAGLALKRKRA